MVKGAVIDETGKYRYQLWRIWDESKPLTVFIMLNPSTADAEEDDPTIRRCMNYARSWGYGGIKVVNLFAYRATNPKELLKVVNPTSGSDNINHIINACKEASIIIAAWGAMGKDLGETAYNWIIPLKEVYCLGTTKYGCPKHPLYLKADLKPVKWAI